MSHNKTAAVLRDFWRGHAGDDLVEYSLILAFVLLAGAAAFVGMSRSTTGIWNTVNSRTAACNQAS